MNTNGAADDPRPAHPAPKRKAADEPNTTAKRPRKDIISASGKRKLRNGEEQPSGLVIVRAGSSRPPSSQSLRPPPPDASSSMSRSPPPTKKFKSSTPASSTSTTVIPTTHRGTGKGKEREVLVSTVRAEGDVDEDVRRMESETDDLRRQSQATTSLHADMSFTNHNDNHNHTDTSIPLEPRETPQIEKNRSMRGDGGGGRGHGRRSSLSMRGKRVSSSFESTGVITSPHSSVDDGSFYKHIDADLPDSARARQLLVWCGMRSAASTEPPVASSSKKRGAKNSGKDPPPLSADALELFNGLVGDTIKMLAEKQINTNVFSPPEAKAQRKMRPNEQNMKNRDRQVKFSGDIERAKAEDAAWSGLDKFYNSHHAAVMSEVEHRRQASAKAKGKQRAENVDAWGPRVDELPSRFRAVDLARKVLLDPPDPQSPLFRTWDEDAYRIDDLHQLLHASVKAASVIETDLDRRFALLNLTLQARSSSLPPPLLHASTTPLSAYLPARVHPHSATDPQDLFRALSRIDMVRKPAQVGDAARRAAREVQRAQAEGMPNERRLTGVPPPTPRKPPGTPRRATTPGRGR